MIKVAGPAALLIALLGTTSLRRGQQLLDSGTVVINGERSTLDLQVAEGKN
jgi:hypothetical protein